MQRMFNLLDVYGIRHWRMRRPFLWVGCIALVASLVVVWLPVWACVAAGCALPLLLLFGACRRPDGLFCILCGSILMLSGLWFRVRAVQPVEGLAGEKDTLVGVVEHRPASGHLYTLRVTEADKLPRGSRVLLYCSDMAAPQRYDTVRAEVRLQSLYSSQSTRRADGVYLLAFPTRYGEESVTVTDTARPSVNSLFYTWRQQLAATLQGALPDDTGALLAGICLGELQTLPDEIYEDFRRSGTVHLLVVSGLHLTMLAAALFGLCRVCRLHRRTAAVLTMMAVVGFSLLVGLTPSVERAAVACLVMLLGQLFRRRPDGLNSMGFALFLLLGANPYACLDVGLQLSFAAVAGILLLTPAVTAALTVSLPTEGAAFRRGLAQTAAVTIGASLTVTPLLCIHFGTISLLTLPANLLAAVPSGWALTLGWAGLLLPPLPLLRVVRELLFRLAGGVCRWLIVVAHLFGGEGSTAYTGRVWQTVLVCGICGLLSASFVWGTPRLRRRLVVYLTAVTLLTVGSVRALSYGATELQIAPAEENAAVLIEYDGRYGLLVTDEEAVYEAGRMLAGSPCRKLDFAVFEGDDPAPWKRLLRGISVENIYMTDSEAAARWEGCLPLAAGEGLPFGEREELCRLSEDGWRLTVGDSTLLIRRADAAPPSQEADFLIYLGVPHTAAAYPTVETLVIGDEEDLPTQIVGILPRRPTVLNDSPRWLSTRGTGEWSVLAWR